MPSGCVYYRIRHCFSSRRPLGPYGIQEKLRYLKRTERDIVMASITHFRLLIGFLFLSNCSSSCFGTLSDIQCLRTLKLSVKDTNGILNSAWNLSNGTEGFICRFTGVECWHPDENRILALRLNNMGLQGQFPQGLENCTSITSLDLSSNDLSGPIPANIFSQLPYLSSLDLSFNRFSGEIPGSISDFTYLNVLNLQHNQFSGQIPGQIGELSRLTSINVADNFLWGPIPDALGMYPPANFFGNQGLCGRPLESCVVWLPGISDEVSIGASVGFFVGFVGAAFFSHRLFFSSA